jgi:hypothetical protein
MQADYMVLADAATVAEGKHYIHGAGWDTLGSVSFPFDQPTIAVAILFRVPWNDANYPHIIELDVVDADGVSILPTPPGPLRGPITVGRPPQITPGNDLLVPLVFNLLAVRFERPGTHVVTLRIAGIEDKRFPLHVVALPQVIVR